MRGKERCHFSLLFCFLSPSKNEDWGCLLMYGLMLMAEDANVTAINTAISSMVDTVKSVITASLPVVLPICAIIVAAGIGVKIFKKFAK